MVSVTARITSPLPRHSHISRFRGGCRIPRVKTTEQMARSAMGYANPAQPATVGRPPCSHTVCRTVASLMKIRPMVMTRTSRICPKTRDQQRRWLGEEEQGGDDRN